MEQKEVDEVDGDGKTVTVTSDKTDVSGTDHSTEAESPESLEEELDPDLDTDTA
ncbi:MAG TPA: hypothetical protein VN843_36095 [Anaerolineales bacterium]|nr:hypothetical protein [Anaerolineales bacterium]